MKEYEREGGEREREIQNISSILQSLFNDAS